MKMEKKLQSVNFLNEKQKKLHMICLARLFAVTAMNKSIRLQKRKLTIMMNEIRMENIFVMALKMIRAKIVRLVLRSHYSEIRVHGVSMVANYCYLLQVANFQIMC